MFLLYGSIFFYLHHVTDASQLTDSAKFEKLFAAAGFNGCIGSTDATHIGMLCCANWAAHNHLGHKLSVPSRTYNATVTHWRQIIGTTCGHLSTWNNKTIILYDDLVRCVNDGVLFQDNEFTLLE